MKDNYMEKIRNENVQGDKNDERRLKKIKIEEN